MNEADYEALFREGSGLINPYLILRDKPAKQPEDEPISRGIELLRRAIELEPSSWPAYWIIGKGYQALGRNEDAWEAFRSSFRINSEHPDVAREYMHECLMLGHAEEGVEAALAAVRMQPSNPGLLANLGLAYLIAGDTASALKAVDQSLKLNKKDKITKNVRKLIIAVQKEKQDPPKSLAELMG